MKRVAIFLLSIFILCASVKAKEETPLEVVKQNIDKVINVLTDKKLSVKEKKKKIKEALETTIDWNEVSKRVLGIYYRNLKKEEVEEFKDLFKKFVENVYARKFLKYSGEKIIYIGQEIEGDYATVRMKLITAKKQEVPVVCKTLRRNGKWLVYDVLIEGISMVNNYRIQINRIIAKRGFKGLIRILKRKVSKIKD